MGLGHGYYVYILHNGYYLSALFTDQTKNDIMVADDTYKLPFLAIVKSLIVDRSPLLAYMLRDSLNSIHTHRSIVFFYFNRNIEREMLTC